MWGAAAVIAALGATTMTAPVAQADNSCDAPPIKPTLNPGRMVLCDSQTFSLTVACPSSSCPDLKYCCAVYDAESGARQRIYDGRLGPGRQSRTINDEIGCHHTVGRAICNTANARCSCDYPR